MNDKTVVIRDSYYREKVDLLKADPIVQKMADEIPPNFLIENLLSEDGYPRFHFMQVANDHYRKENGKIVAHIGGVAEAITELIKER